MATREKVTPLTVLHKLLIQVALLRVANFEILRDRTTQTRSGSSVFIRIQVEMVGSMKLRHSNSKVRKETFADVR